MDLTKMFWILKVVLQVLCIIKKETSDASETIPEQFEENLPKSDGGQID